MGHEEENTWFFVHHIVYYFKISAGNQCLLYCIRILTALSLSSFIYPAGLFAKKSSSEKDKDAIINLIHRNYLDDQYKGAVPQNRS